jgi:hypothetical protein
LRRSDGSWVDYSSARVVVRDLAINYYGAAGGGPWIGYQGLSTGLLSSAVLGNILALCTYECHLSESEWQDIHSKLQEIYDLLISKADPF